MKLQITDSRLLAALMYWMNKYQNSGASIAITRRGVIERRVALVKLVNDVLASPRFRLDDDFRLANLIKKALKSNDERMLMKLLNWPLLAGDYLRTRILPHPCLFKCNCIRPDIIYESVLQECLESKTPCPILVFEKLLQFAEMRNEIVSYVVQFIHIIH